MINFTVTSKTFLENRADCFVFLVTEDFKFTSDIRAVEKDFFPQLKSFMRSKSFTGKIQTSLIIPVSLNDGSVVSLMFVGLGKSKDSKKLDIENLRRALGAVIRLSEKNKFKELALKLPSASVFGVDGQYLGKQVATVLNMANYHFDKYLTNKESQLQYDFDIILSVSDKYKQDIKKGLKDGGYIASCVNKARYWVDSPPNDLTPVQLADDAKAIAKKHGLKITVFDEQRVNELGMGGLAAVSKGSERDCRLVIMEYKAKKKSAATLALVGKGITFDSGGLSLKPSAYMETMKEDMSGAAAVLAAMDAIAYLKPNVNVVCIAPLSENLPSGKAVMPGDVVRFYNGKTAEIKNTDAEGRLILADALSYAVKHYKPDYMIDLATLTGACQYALGPFFCGLMSKHKDFVKKVKKASNLSGDKVWELPFNDDYKPAIKSTIADISNIGSKKYMAGTITAGFFLQNFVGDTPWVHLDIAGTAFDVPDISYFRSGATGFGVRLLVELASSF